jgi:hypothetical protein
MSFSATISSYTVHLMLRYWYEEKWNPFRYSKLVKSNTQLVRELGFHLRSQIMTVNNSLFVFAFYLPLYFLRATQSTRNVKVSWSGILWRQTGTLLSNDLYLSLGRQDLTPPGDLLLIACLKLLHCMDIVSNGSLRRIFYMACILKRVIKHLNDSC